MEGVVAGQRGVWISRSGHSWRLQMCIITKVMHMKKGKFERIFVYVKLVNNLQYTESGEGKWARINSVRQLFYGGKVCDYCGVTCEEARPAEPRSSLPCCKCPSLASYLNNNLILCSCVVWIERWAPPWQVHRQLRRAAAGQVGWTCLRGRTNQGEGSNKCLNGHIKGVVKWTQCISVFENLSREA